MKYIAKHIIILCSLLVVLNSCERETNWDIKSSEAVIIVDAIITNENKAQEIRVYFSHTNLNEPSVPLSGVEIILTDGINKYSFIESTSIAGLYISDAFQTASNINYSLIIDYKGIVDSANASMVPISPLREYSFEQKGDLTKYNDPGSDLPAMTEVFYDWSTVPSYCSIYGACTAVESFYVLDIIDIGKEFAPKKQEILFPPGTIIKRKKYSLSKEHQNFVRSLLIETEWRGSLFDVEQGNIPTNFRHGTKGWFGVCQVLSDSVTVPSN